MSEPQWLDIDIVLDIHAEQLALWGRDGLGERRLLETALAGPRKKFAYAETDPAVPPPPMRSGSSAIIRLSIAISGRPLASIIGFSAATDRLRCAARGGECGLELAGHLEGQRAGYATIGRRHESIF